MAFSYQKASITQATSVSLDTAGSVPGTTALPWNLADYPFHMVHVTGMAGSNKVTCSFLPAGLTNVAGNHVGVAVDLENGQVYGGTNSRTGNEHLRIADVFGFTFDVTGTTAVITVWSWGSWETVTGV